jgi:CRISPR-associated exonuclease Cas4
VSGFTYSEDDLQPISALQHLMFCERQWGLIHLEGIWTENRLTAEGRVLHERAHTGETESRGGVRVARGLRLHSLRLGLSGVADVVEFHRVEESDEPDEVAGVCLRGVPGRWRPFPVEYKRGRPKKNPCDAIQLCAQALCLEEMLDTRIPCGGLFYGKTRRRHDVEFTPSLREETETLCARLHALFQAGETPQAAYEPKCESCSLLEQCMPKITGSPRSAKDYLRKAMKDCRTKEAE